jgi:hypothetical protein
MVSCKCNSGYYGNGLNCTVCKTCSSNALMEHPCLAGAASFDSVVCTCNSGYYGDGMTCTPCSCTSQNAETQCPGGVIDNFNCRCKVGYYGTGLNPASCTACKTCSAHATKGGADCVAGSKSDTLTCACNVGYYGDGVTCTACKKCHDNATLSGMLCQMGQLLDTVKCMCKDGFYGSGFECAPCVCDKNAKVIMTCIGGDGDSQVCSCNEGFTGDGRNCRINTTSSTCSRTKSWILGNCQGVTASDVDILLGTKGGVSFNQSQCTLPYISCPLSGSRSLMPAVNFLLQICLLLNIMVMLSHL